VTYSVPSPGIPVNHLGKIGKVEEGYPEKGECLEEVGNLEGVNCLEGVDYLEVVGYLVQGGNLEQGGRQKRRAGRVRQVESYRS